MKAIEHMTESNPIYGPKIVNKEKCEREYPTIYGTNTYLIDGTLQKELPPTPVDSVRPLQGGAPIAPTPEASTSRPGDNPSGPKREIMPGVDRQPKDRAPTLLDKQSVSGPSSSWEQDDGIVSSDTATSNPLFSQVYTSNPYFQTSFPVSGPPQPFLTDFSKMHS